MTSLKNDTIISEAARALELMGTSRAEKGRAVNLGPLCDAEKDWHERSFRASGEINGCQKFPLNEPEINFSFFIFEPPVV